MTYNLKKSPAYLFIGAVAVSLSIVATVILTTPVGALVTLSLWCGLLVSTRGLRKLGVETKRDFGYFIVTFFFAATITSILVLSLLGSLGLHGVFASPIPVNH